MKNNVKVGEWVSMFETIGLSDEMMHQWHELFEERHPQGHHGFLDWLGLSASEVERIRASSRERTW